MTREDEDEAAEALAALKAVAARHEAAEAQPAYPVPRPPPGESDPRFTYGLLLRIEEVLVDADFPKPAGTDHTYLQHALFGFIYGSAPARKD